MKKIKDIYPSEWFLIMFLTFVLTSLIFKSNICNFINLFIFLLLLLTIYICIQKETQKILKIKLLYYPFAMVFIYFLLKKITFILHPEREDLFLQKIDQLLIGGNLSIKIESFANAFISEIMYICYFLFFPYILFSIIFYYKKKNHLMKGFYEGLFTIYWIGFLGYVLMPALGPYIAMADQFKTPVVEGYFFSRIIHNMILIGANKCDVFPSLHFSISAYILLFDRKFTPWRYKRYLPFCILIWISIIYLRYHYFIDIAIGFFLTVFALRITNFFIRKEHNISIMSSKN